MLNNNIEMRLLIKGKPITEYAHNGQLFVEGRHNSNFEIELINHNPFQVEAIVSVDGLSVIDGKDAGPASSGYVLQARETVRIPGWKLNDASVAAFQFAGKKDSYAAQSTGSSRNTGVIGVLAYKEKWPVYSGPQVHSFSSPTYSKTVSNDLSWSTGGLVQTCGSALSGDALSPFQVANYYSGNASCGMLNQTSLSASSHVEPSITCSVNANTASIQGMADMTSCLRAASPLEAECAVKTAFIQAQNTVQASAAALPKNNLGTAFGEETAFATTTVTFARGDMLAMSVIYYDDATGLRARGIDLHRRKKARPTEPVAFPGLQTGCVPPKGWRR